MGRRRSKLIVAIAALAIPGTAVADGLPVLGIDVGASGVESRDGATRYVTLPAGDNTLVARVATDGGQVQASGLLTGTLTIPAVAYDGSASGVSADGTRLALIEPRASFPRERTRFVVVNSTTLRTVARVDLVGDFSFDAISPDGGSLYLTHYTSPNDPTVYHVRGYDIAADRLGPPIIDPTEPDELMGGAPVTRLMSSDGRWAYTLYDRFDGHEPFIHALDTVGATARCIDLPMLAPGLDPAATKLVAAADGRSFTVQVSSRTVATIDQTTLSVIDPTSVVATEPQTGSASSTWGWIVGSLGALVLAGVIALVGPRAARRRGADLG